MDFTMAELRHELLDLGYGALPEEFIVSTMAQLYPDVPTDAWNKENGGKDRSSARRSRARQVHGPPVPGDREFAQWKGGLVRVRDPSSFKKGGLHTVCFTPDFASELDEMRKMLQVMQGTSTSTLQGTEPKPIGLEDEHELYVGNLKDNWRQVGRTIRGKGKDSYGNAVPSVGLERRDLQAGSANQLPESDQVSRSKVMKNNHADGMAQPSINGYSLGFDPTIPGFTRQTSSSEISPGVSYKPGGMLYPEHFTADLGANYEGGPSHQDSEHDNATQSPASSGQTPKEVLHKLSSLSKDQFLVAFRKSLEDLNPQDVIDQETFANVNQKISDTVSCSQVSHLSYEAQPVGTKNPLDSGAAVLRTPDRRGGGHQVPLNDRSNISIAGDSGSHGMFAKTESNSAAAKRNSAVTLRRSRSSRIPTRRNEIVEEAKDPHLSDIVEEGQVGNATTPPRSARKLKVEEVLNYCLSERISPRVTLRSKGASDSSDLDIPSLGLSPIKVREPTSPSLFAGRERSGVGNGLPEQRLGANGLPEPRLGSCSVCPPSVVRKSGESLNSSTSGNKSPLDRKSESVSSENSEVSPQQKRSAKKEAGPPLKQKIALRKSSAPSGIYTPLVDPKKTDVNSKVLLKTRKLGSSMDFTSDSSRFAERRSPSLRSSTESTKSSGAQPAGSSSPYAKTSSFGTCSSRSATPKDMITSTYGKTPSFASYGSRATTSKETITPGGPRRGGKVDRVAR